MEEFGSFKRTERRPCAVSFPRWGAWALAFGCAVGWGAFVMPGNVFLLKAGPLGTSVGMAVGALIMLLIGVNYHFMMNRFPDAGGAFAFTKNVLGYDQGLSERLVPCASLYLRAVGQRYGAGAVGPAAYGRYAAVWFPLRYGRLRCLPGRKSWQWWRPLSSAR